MTKGLDTVKKRTHLKITTVSEEVTYPLKSWAKNLNTESRSVLAESKSGWQA